MYTDLRFRPTLGSTLRQMAAVSWAIWQDYREFTRLARRQAKMARFYAVAPDSWQQDACHVAVVAFTVVAAVALALFMAGAWGPLLAWLGVA